MQGVLNEKTKTVHRLGDGPDARGTATYCGALTYVSHPHITHIDEVDSIASQEEVSRCGRCFEDVTAGY